MDDFLEILIEFLFGLLDLFHFVVFHRYQIVNSLDFVGDVFDALNLGLLFVDHIIVQFHLLQVLLRADKALFDNV